MGACVATPEKCIGGGIRSSKKKFRRRRRGLRRRVSSRFSDRSKYVSSDHAVANPTFNGGSTDESWYDSAAILESECSDEDYQSVFDDVLSLDGSEGVSRQNIASLRGVNHGDSEIRRSSVHPEDMESRSRSDGTSFDRKPVYLDEISSSVDENAEREDVCWALE